MPPPSSRCTLPGAPPQRTPPRGRAPAPRRRCRRRRPRFLGPSGSPAPAGPRSRRSPGTSLAARYCRRRRPSSPPRGGGMRRPTRWRRPPRPGAAAPPTRTPRCRAPRPRCGRPGPGRRRCSPGSRGPMVTTSPRMTPTTPTPPSWKIPTRPPGRISTSRHRRRPPRPRRCPSGPEGSPRPGGSPRPPFTSTTTAPRSMRRSRPGSRRGARRRAPGCLCRCTAWASTAYPPLQRTAPPRRAAAPAVPSRSAGSAVPPEAWASTDLPQRPGRPALQCRCSRRPPRRTLRRAGPWTAAGSRRTPSPTSLSSHTRRRCGASPGRPTGEPWAPARRGSAAWATPRPLKSRPSGSSSRSSSTSAS
mmetsp:Transcript_28775/g.95614  ORF Transcript_28775/g.95614 Transcript_28775/m.95614 type:complete len:360 (+) Transcript_28775:2341-3420(+)